MATYREYIEQLCSQAQKEGITESLTANLMAATILMQRDRDAAVKKDEMTMLAGHLNAQPSFKRLMADPASAELVKKGKGLNLIEKMAIKENERRQEIDKYRRPDEYVAEDGLFLRHAVDTLKNKSSTATTGAAQKGFQGEHFREMIKQLEYAESMAEKGLQLSGDDTKKLIDAVKKYNDGGTKVAGGVHKAKAFTDSMCILKRYMPENEFRSYCADINDRHKKKIDPESYVPERVMGQAKSVQELRSECRTKLQENFSLENCAALAAISMVPLKNGVIMLDDFEAQKKKLLSSGSAFSTAMKDDKVKEKVSDILQKNGKSDSLVRAMNKGAMTHAGKTAQWQLNRSKGILTSNRANINTASANLANVIAVYQFSKKVEMGDEINGKGFESRAREIEKDPSFQRMAERYASEPGYRNHINAKLSRDPSGKSMADEFARMQRLAQRQKQAQQAPQNPQL